MLDHVQDYDHIHTYIQTKTALDDPSNNTLINTMHGQ